MKHPTEGELRRSLDGALNQNEIHANEIRRVQAHLQGCFACRQRADTIQARSQQVNQHLSHLPMPVKGSTPTPTARRRLEKRLSQPPMEVSMTSRWFSRVSRTTWAVAALVLIFAITMLFAPVRAIASSFLGLFRVQQIQAVRVDAQVLDTRLAESNHFQEMLSDQAQFEEIGVQQQVSSVAQASTAAGFTVRLPAGWQDAELSVNPGGRMTFTIAIEQIDALLYEMGRTDLRLPQQLDGKTVVIEIPISVAAGRGACEAEKPHDPDMPAPSEYQDASQYCFILMQMPSPTITAPDGLDTQMLGQIYLEILGLSPEEAARYAATVDWSSTFVLPVPDTQATFKEVQVDGVTGLLLESIDRQDLSLLWVKNGIIYGLYGAASSSEALRLVKSMP